MPVIIQPKAKILYPSNSLEWENELKWIELAARTCYQSELSTDDNKPFIKRLVKRGHHAMLEFGSMHVVFTTNRGRTHDIVRHRLFSFAQESTQYCRYKSEIMLTRPATFDQWSQRARDAWSRAQSVAEESYQIMLEEGCKPQEAAFVLTNSTKAEIHVKGNFREWLHFFSLRDSNSDHIDMKELVHPLHVEVQCLCPTIFGEEEAVGAGT